MRLNIGLIANSGAVFSLKHIRQLPDTYSLVHSNLHVTFFVKRHFLFFPGINRYLDCIEIMYGFRIFVVWKWMFLVVAPITVTVVFVLNCISYRYANINKLLLVSSTQFALVIWPIHNFLYRQLINKTVLSRLGQKIS